jgi:hypothetical protein
MNLIGAVLTAFLVIVLGASMFVVGVALMACVGVACVVVGLVLALIGLCVQFFYWCADTVKYRGKSPEEEGEES